jgi:hypothetical protein
MPTATDFKDYYATLGADCLTQMLQKQTETRKE